MDEARAECRTAYAVLGDPSLRERSVVLTYFKNNSKNFFYNSQSELDSGAKIFFISSRATPYFANSNIFLTNSFLA
ncbi:hypothetical protein COS38_01085 [Candidatus Berkelbacteria bacterium CG03_land_8_20_14_0_80_40_36]|uniref:Uncharacterized protein n=1 Tax=Candidatus Berkelbacteria bacterium CG03_land_8_20_14_0_80_40_36 TaxID=1974509 RepID=A0A2M7CIR9_9BACT|nr:MAG: hypothetical protein COS38_01085 [Candidatus Berkelbacteria bacterium CG03_land_8_20_14_0_80_40_36]